MYKTVPSLLRPQTHAYEVLGTTSDSYDRRGRQPLSSQVMEFETYGDGLTKHSNSWCTQFEQLTDFCLSLTAAILNEPSHEIWKRLAYHASRHTERQLRFALSVKFNHKEGSKRQFYSLAEQKITTADKRHDRRYEEVLDWHDGSPASAFRILTQSYDDWIDRLIRAHKLRELYEYSQQMEEIIPDLKHLKDSKDSYRWHQALTALIHALQAVEALDNASISHHNALPTPQTDEQAA